MRPAWARLRARLRGFRHESLIHEITARCNLACPHCYNVWKDPGARPAAELPPPRLRALVELVLAQSRCRHYTFTGGEPTLRPDLEDLVRTVRRRGVTAGLITNGTRLPPARIAALVAAGVDLFELPLHGGTAAVHDAALGHPGAFAAVTRAAAEIRCAGGRIAFVFVGTRATIGHWRAALDLGIALGARSFLLNRYNAGGSAHARPQDLLPGLDELRAALAVAEDYAARYGLAIGVSIAIPPCLIDPRAYPHLGFGFCAAGTPRAYYTIDPVGNLRPCNHSPTLLGNLWEQPLDRLIRSPAMTAFRAARPDFCNPCPLAARCQGGCKAAAEACCGSLSACEPFLAANRDAALAGRERLASAGAGGPC